jgi:sulfur transfer complex TusBCD TusB component (DsrH family)
MLFLISSAPDTKEFQTSFRTAKEMNADICLLQNAVYAARNFDAQRHQKK